MRKKINKGSSLLEILLAVALVAVVVVGLVRLTTLSVRNSGLANDRIKARSLAREMIEWLVREKEENGWTSLAARAGSTYCANDLESPWQAESVCNNTVITGTIYDRKLTLGAVDSSPPDGEMMAVGVVVTWNDRGETKELAISSSLSNW